MGDREHYSGGSGCLVWSKESELDEASVGFEADASFPTITEVKYE